MPLDNQDWGFLRENLRDPLVEELQKLRKSFTDQAVKAPEIFKTTPKNGDFIRQDANTAVRIKHVGMNLALLYQFDFEAQLAVIMSFQNGQLAATETRKLTDMPVKMVNAAQQAISGKSGSHTATRIQRRER